jgi:predicted PurR-regulated permease PerM
MSTVDKQVAEDRESAAAASDPVVDAVVARVEAGADEDNPFGRPGRPLSRRSPFMIGLFGALGVATAYLLVQMIANARQVIVLLLAAAFLALGLDPAVAALERRGLSRRAAISIVFLVVIVVFVGFAAAIVPPVIHQVTNFGQQLPDYLDELRHNPRIASLDARFHFLDRAREFVTNRDVGTRALGGVLGVGRVVLSTTLSALTILILTLYLLGSLPAIKETAYRMAPRSRRARVKLLGDEILGKVGGYVAGALTISLIAGTAACLFLLATGAPYPLALAMLVAVTDLVPLIGATIGAVAVTVVCFVTSIPLGIASTVFFIAYQQVENYVIYPRVMGRTVDVSPAATIVAALLGGALLGMLGALLAIPTAAAVSLIVREVVMPRQDAL